MPGRAAGTRTIALVGPGGAGKTSLAEALLFAAGAISRQGSVADGTSVGDASPEARARGGSTELNLMHLDYMDDRYALIDAPGSVGFAADGALGAAAADLALVVVDPDPDRALLAEPTLRQLEALGIPHMIFVNKIDQARGSIQDLLEALQPMSASPLIARWIPIRDGEKIAGFVDIALERAYYYRPGQASEQKEIPDDLADRETLERGQMLEKLADHDDTLLEQLLMDEVPDRQTVFADLAKETGAAQIVPVLFGSAMNGYGVRRLLKALRHEVPDPAAAAERLGASAGCAFVFKVSNSGAMGRLTYARIFGGGLREGSELKGPEGDSIRIGTLFALQGEKTVKLAEAKTGDVVAIAKLEGVGGGQWLSGGKAPPSPEVGEPARNFALAIHTKDRKDDVRLSTALHKLTEEDRALNWEQDEVMHETRLRGVNDEHLKVTLERLKRRYGVAVDFEAAVDRLQGVDPTDGHPAGPSQEAVGRPRPVRRCGDRGEAVAARGRVQVRREDFRRRRAQAVDSGGRGRSARRDGEGSARIPRRRCRRDPDRRLVPHRRQLGDRVPHRRADRHVGSAGRGGAAFARTGDEGDRGRAQRRHLARHLGDRQPARTDARHGAARGLVALGPGRGADPRGGDAGLRRRAALAQPGPRHLPGRI